MTSLPVIETRPITPKPLQIGVSFLLNTNGKSLGNKTANINVKKLSLNLSLSLI